MRRVLVLVLAVLLVPAAAASAAPCDTPPKHRVEVAGAAAVVFVRVEDDLTSTYRVCSRRTGRVTELGRFTDTHDVFSRPRFRVAWGYVVSLVVDGTRDPDDQETYVDVREAATGAAVTRGSVSGETDVVVVGRDGHVAMTEPHGGDRLVLFTADERRELSPGREVIADVRFDGPELHWTADATPRSATLPPPARISGFLACGAEPGERVVAVGSPTIFERGGRRRTYRTCVPSGSAAASVIHSLGPVGGRDSRVERLVTDYQSVVAVFERVVRRGRARLRVRAMDPSSGESFGGRLRRSRAPRRKEELVDVAVGAGGVAWLERRDRRLFLGARSPGGMVRGRRLPLTADVGNLTVDATRVTWVEDGRRRQRRLPR